jgi:iron complex transport system ATP-binding protein
MSGHGSSHPPSGPHREPHREHSDEPVLRLRDLDVGYRSAGRRRAVLAGITADLAAGELACLVGPNGAGKTTLLRSIAGLQPALAGQVLLAGLPLARLSRRQIARQVAAVLTDRVDPGQLSAREVVALGRHPHTDWTGRMSPRDQDAVDTALAQAGAAELAASQFGELSDGQRQRVLIARALAQQPVLLLLDEPTAFLDPPARIGLLALLASIAATGSVAVLVCSHEMELAARTADVLWVASGGTLVGGGPEDLAHAGTLAAAFTSEGAAFDMATLGFAAADAAAPTAAVDGEGLERVLAAHALRRAGYQITGPDGPAEVRVRVRPGPGHEIHSAICWRGQSAAHVSLDALARHARSLRDRQIPSSEESMA